MRTVLLVSKTGQPHSLTHRPTEDAMPPLLLESRDPVVLYLPVALPVVHLGTRPITQREYGIAFGHAAAIV